VCGNSIDQFGKKYIRAVSIQRSAFSKCQGQTKTFTTEVAEENPEVTEGGIATRPSTNQPSAFSSWQLTRAKIKTRPLPQRSQRKGTEVTEKCSVFSHPQSALSISAVGNQQVPRSKPNPYHRGRWGKGTEVTEECSVFSHPQWTTAKTKTTCHRDYKRSRV